MKPRPLRCARIVWADDGTPHAPDFGDLYRPQGEPLDQARQVFLVGNGLPERWRGRADFTIAETGFGLGNNFVATWLAWRADPQRPRRLHYVAIEGQPPAVDDLRRAHASLDHADPAVELIDAWPPIVRGLHRLDFEEGALRLLLVLDEANRVLPGLSFAADAFYLDGFAPKLNPEMWTRPLLSALGRRALPGATAATWSVARAVRDGLVQAGFECERVSGTGRKHEVLRARHVPRDPRRAVVTPTIEVRQAAIVGAGLAGACVAAALAALDFEVTVIDRLALPAEGSSGNPAGLFHATVHADDGPYERLYRAGALHTARLLASLGEAVDHSTAGLLRLERERDPASMQALLDSRGLPPSFVRACTAAEASVLAGVEITSPAWLYLQGGWVSPPQLVRRLLSRPGIRFVGNCAVHSIRRDADFWQLLDAAGTEVAAAPQIVLANAEGAQALLEPLGLPPLGLQRSRGQVSAFAGPPSPLRLPVAGDGYAIALPAGGLLCGATSQRDDESTVVRSSDHALNFGRLARLCGLAPPPDANRWTGRVGWRVRPADRLPLAGAVQAIHLPAACRLDQARLLPRELGLHLLVGLGARGLSLAPLLGEVVAARIAGTPVPLEQDLLDAVDPARALVRAARRGR